QQQLAQRLASSGVRPGMQQLSLSGAGPGAEGISNAGGNDAAALAGAGLPNAGLATEGGSESLTVSGAMGRSEQNLIDPGAMQGHELRLCLCQLGELAFERIGDTAMQLLAPSPQQARVRCILQQGVLEDIRGIRRLATAKDQSSACELIQSRLQCIAGNRCDGREQAIRELTTDSRADLGNLLDRAEPIKTRHQ